MLAVIVIKVLCKNIIHPLYSGLQHKLRWTHLNPQEVLEEVRNMKFQFPLSTMEAYMKRAGVTSAYMKKPCLDPTDPECPDSAPNKKSGQVSCMLNYVVAVFSTIPTLCKG